MSVAQFFYEPFYTLSDFDRLFEEAFSARGENGGQVQRGVTQNQSPNRALRPKMDVHENKDTNTVTVWLELPGLKKEDVSIDVHNNVLTVSGESKAETERSEDGWVVRERRSGRLTRSVPLPQGVKSEQIKANMENGVLSVTFPKSTPEAAPKKIAIA
ncbi:small heat shock protein [Artomyces pyxidatus]|uniref:Small heat shock protein n=1 Tax=Artomyces pyxidatus TaxID=48021 RepID=A0ACB8T2I8_9AGAM|nr:small heat shock protein [Artomyces pyxidatus]